MSSGVQVYRPIYNQRACCETLSIVVQLVRGEFFDESKPGPAGSQGPAPAHLNLASYGSGSCLVGPAAIFRAPAAGHYRPWRGTLSFNCSTAVFIMQCAILKTG
jgi:hypothetical protein